MPLDLLINNAGLMSVHLRGDAGGNESQPAVNYPAVFRLAARLREPLKPGLPGIWINRTKILSEDSFQY